MLLLDFADDDGWRGCVLVEGTNDIVEAVTECHRRGCNPGGEVMGFEVPTAEWLSPEERVWFATQPRWTVLTEPPPGSVKMADLDPDVFEEVP